MTLGTRLAFVAASVLLIVLPLSFLATVFVTVPTFVMGGPLFNLIPAAVLAVAWILFNKAVAPIVETHWIAGWEARETDTRRSRSIDT